MDGFAELIERKRQGSLKVYLGYAAGVGKTYAMLQEGLRLKQQHVDVVIGYLEPHDRPETMALAEHLETVPPREWRVGDAVFHEMDVEAILARKPQVVLVDELAHTNADGSKNDKRYSDVLEVLAQGINVISTINVQHLESVAARVEEATGIAVRERIPDTVLRRADQVVNVDVTKEELREPPARQDLRAATGRAGAVELLHLREPVLSPGAVPARGIRGSGPQDRGAGAPQARLGRVCGGGGHGRPELMAHRCRIAYPPWRAYGEPARIAVLRGLCPQAAGKPDPHRRGHPAPASAQPAAGDEARRGSGAA